MNFLSFGEQSDLLMFALLLFMSGNMFTSSKQAPDCSCFASVVSLYFHFSLSSPIFHPIFFVVSLFYGILHTSQLNHYLSFKGKNRKSYSPSSGNSDISYYVCLWEKPVTKHCLGTCSVEGRGGEEDESYPVLHLMQVLATWGKNLIALFASEDKGTFDDCSGCCQNNLS